MNLEIHPAVSDSDVPQIFAYIARNDLAAADRVLGAIHATFAQIASSPRCGVVYQPKDARLVRMRMLPVHQYRNYLVFYRTEAKVARILYVVHGASYLHGLFSQDRRS